MPIITRALLRKRSEHNEGVISTMEEISLHQEELEGINEVLGMTCRKLKILYLQNNIIPKMENLYHLKELEYLNLALNNVQRIEGLQNCEFLKKLDLTINFIDLDELKYSIEHLASRQCLIDLFLMGNPAQANWDKFNMYVIAKLPQLQNLDGTEITKSMQIQARQQLPKLEVELERLAGPIRIEKAMKEASKPKPVAPVVPTPRVVELAEGEELDDLPEDEVVVEDDNEMTENTPEARIKIYQELAQQKKEKEDRAKVNQPRERNYDKEQVQSVAEIRAKESELEENSEIKQRNEGGWDFFWDEESKPGCVILDVHVAKHLDSSLMDVDVHPHYISIVIKSKVLRLRLPAEVKVSESKCQRSKVTGSLMVIMPKVNPKENAISIRGDIKARSAQQTNTNLHQDRTNRPPAAAAVPTPREVRSGNTSKATTSKPKKLSLQEQMIQDALESAAASAVETDTSLFVQNTDENSGKAVNLSNIVRQAPQSASEPADLFELNTVFQKSSRVTELD